MKNKLTKGLSIAIVLIILAVSCAVLISTGTASVIPASAAPGDTATLTIESKCVAQDETFTVVILIDTGTSQTRSAQFSLSWNPCLLELNTVTQGTFYSSWVAANPDGSGTDMVFFNQGAKNNNAGTLSKTSFAILSGTPGGPAGAGTLATLSFTALDVDGISSLNFAPVGDAVVKDAGIVNFGTVNLSNGSVTVESGTPAMESIAVTPASASIAMGQTQQYTAIGTYSDCSTQDITSSVNWASSNTSVATVNSSTGLVMGVAAGTTNISASLSEITSNSAALTVTASALESIAVTPSTASIIKGTTTQQYTAIGTYSDSSTQDLTSSVNWASSNELVATISSTGLAAGVAAGTAVITASLSGVTSNNADLTVTPATLVSIAVTPSTASIIKLQTRQYTAIGTYSDSTTQDITSSVNWDSSSTSVATISSTGLATGVAEGTAVITASLSGVTSNNANLTVIVTTPVISVSPSMQSVGLGDSFTVNVDIDTLIATRAMQFSLSWDPALVQLDSVTNGSFYAGWPTGVYFNHGSIDNVEGTLTGAAVALLGGPSGSGAEGQGTVMTLHFTALSSSSGFTPMTLSDVVLGDVDIQPLTIEVNSGQVAVTAAATNVIQGRISGTIMITPPSDINNWQLKLGWNTQTGTVNVKSNGKYQVLLSDEDSTTNGYMRQWDGSAYQSKVLSNSLKIGGQDMTNGNSVVLANNQACTTAAGRDHGILYKQYIDWSDPTLPVGDMYRIVVTYTAVQTGPCD